MEYIKNPILPGFNPDPSIIRVGDDYYIATSTFEWFPGVQIHHSRDLVNWELVARPLNRVSQLDMRGIPDSCGIWAPCLSYHNGTFYLIYTVVKGFSGIFQDTHNYLVSAEDILGEWSEPVYLNSTGFDPSLFHDDDGKKWLLNMTWDFRKGRNPFGGIILQEYSPEEKRLVGPVTNIFKGTPLCDTEGPHLYKINGYYYLITAEGGTGTNHSVTMARSKSITGPYEVHPENPILTARVDPTLELQKSGHADIVETQNGEWYMVHLCGRPIPSRGRCTLGRETCIQKMIWCQDGWLRLEAGGNKPKVEVPAPKLPRQSVKNRNIRDEFNSDVLDINFQSLRVPLGEDVFSLKERPGFLRLKGKESLISKFTQSFVARRQQAFCYTATTCIEFEPQSFKQMAGLICWYNTQNFLYLRITHNETLGKCLGIITCDNGAFDHILDAEISLEGLKRCYLRVKVDYDKLRFYYSKDGENWIFIGDDFDASKLSDDYVKGWAFTGAFVGLCCQDLSGLGKHADFDFFEYTEREFQG